MKGKLLKVDIEKINSLIRERFEDDYKGFAADVNLDPSTVYRVITGRTNGGTKFFNGLMGYCNQHGLEFDDYLDNVNDKEQGGETIDGN